MAKNKISERDLERYRLTNIGQPLTEIARDFQRRALAVFAERGHVGLQPAHTAVITNLSLEGNRLTELARRASMTKQGMGQLVDELERLGYVDRVPDPSDKRAKIVRFSGRGRQLMSDGVEIGELIQAEYAKLIGRKRLMGLHGTLHDLKHWLRNGAARPRPGVGRRHPRG